MNDEPRYGSVLRGNTPLPGSPRRFVTLTVPSAVFVPDGEALLRELDAAMAEDAVPMVVLSDGFLLGFTDLGEE